MCIRDRYLSSSRTVAGKRVYQHTCNRKILINSRRRSDPDSYRGQVSLISPITITGLGNLQQCIIVRWCQAEQFRVIWYMLLIILDHTVDDPFFFTSQLIVVNFFFEACRLKVKSLGLFGL